MSSLRPPSWSTAEAGCKPHHCAPLLPPPVSQGTFLETSAEFHERVNGGDSGTDTQGDISCSLQWPEAGGCLPMDPPDGVTDTFLGVCSVPAAQMDGGGPALSGPRSGAGCFAGA